MPSAVDALDVVRDRLGRDLRTRFPDARLELYWDEDGLCIEVDRGFDVVGFVGGCSVEQDDDDLTDADVEMLLYQVTFELAENLWPDHLDDPWPLCPVHEPHPMSPDLRRGRAVWLCLQDRRTSIDIGSLAGTQGPKR